MKCIIFGLGNFGAALGVKLTNRGNEVIGVDNQMSKVEAYRDKLSHTICLDSTDQYTVSGLPFDDTDIVIVAIGEDQGANIMTTAILKNLKVKRLISRAINPVHEQVLHAIGVDEIVHPEEETAERWSKKLTLKNIVDSFELTGKYSIVEVDVPQHFVGKSLHEIGLRRNHNLVVLTTIKKVKKKNVFGVERDEQVVQGVATAETVLNADEILVIYGDNNDIKNLFKIEKS